MSKQTWKDTLPPTLRAAARYLTDALVRAAAKFGVRHPRHDEAALDDLCPNSGASKGVCGCAQDQTRAGLAGREEVLSILTDLIEHLRAWEEVSHPAYLAWMADRAEARLREVQGE